MKNKIKRLLAAVIAVVIMATGMGGITVNAETLSDEETNEVVLEGDTVTPRSATATKTYNTSGKQNIGKFIASSTTVHLSFSAPKVGQAAIKFHTGGYNGAVYKTIITPVEGTTSTNLTTTFSVNAGTTYYITVEPANGFISTSGSFTITY